MWITSFKSTLSLSFQSPLCEAWAPCRKVILKSSQCIAEKEKLQFWTCYYKAMAPWPSRETPALSPRKNTYISFNSQYTGIPGKGRKGKTGLKVKKLDAHWIPLPPSNCSCLSTYSYKWDFRTLNRWAMSLVVFLCEEVLVFFTNSVKCFRGLKIYTSS